MKLWEQLIVPPGRRVHLAKWDPDDTLGHAKGAATDDALAQGIARLDELQYAMYADQHHALLVVLQGMDAAGKDGTIRHVMSGFNPQGCHVTAFKRPSAEEAAHDFLWRVHRALPARGDIAIFNRSHYEGVLVARLRQLVPRDVRSRRTRRPSPACAAAAACACRRFACGCRAGRSIRFPVAPRGFALGLPARGAP